MEQIKIFKNYLTTWVVFLNKLKRFFSASFIDKINFIEREYRRLLTFLWYKPHFLHIGSGSYLEKPLLISNPMYIQIGSNTSIRKGIRLEVIKPYPHRIPSLVIGSNVNIEQNVHIVCHSRLIIGSNVSITANCAIVDVTHPYQTNYGMPEKIGNTILDEDSYVEIEDGVFIGIGTIILPNVKIGKKSIIGANSVVTTNIPPYSIALGSPARVIKQYRESDLP